MKKLKIIIDVDDVICVSSFFKLVNQVNGTNYKIEELTDYYTDNIIKSQSKKDEFYDLLLKVNFYDDAIIFPDVYEVLEKLCKYHDVYICSACVILPRYKESGIFFDYKYSFLINNFPFLDPNKIILTNSKNILISDYQIDDRFDNMQSKHVKHKLLFDAYHNKNFTDEFLKENNAVRVKNWKEIEKIFFGE